MVTNKEIMETKGRLDLETQLLEAILRKLNSKELIHLKEEFNIPVVICLQVAIQYCIENIDFIKSHKEKYT